MVQMEQSVYGLDYCPADEFIMVFKKSKSDCASEEYFRLPRSTMFAAQ